MQQLKDVVFWENNWEWRSMGEKPLLFNINSSLLFDYLPYARGIMKEHILKNYTCILALFINMQREMQ